MIEFDLLKDGKRMAVTLSFDDGWYDERLVALLNKYGIKGTFHLNSVNLKKQNPNFFNRISEIYAGHEVACHGATHPTFDNLPPEALYNEVYEDRRLLEEKTGYPVVGMSYPYGR